VWLRYSYLISRSPLIKILKTSGAVRSQKANLSLYFLIVSLKKDKSMSEDTTYQKRYKALLEKLKKSDNWAEHLPEVIEFFGETRRFVVVESPFAADTAAEI